MVKLLPIFNKSAVREYAVELSSFAREVYSVSFPDDDEREDFQTILSRIGNSAGRPQTHFVLSVSENTVLGGIITDWYPECGALEIIYIAVAPSERRRRIGNLLITDGLKLIMDEIGREAIRNVFLEIENPEDSATPSPFSFNSRVRLGIWKHWGAAHIPIRYVQPSLSPGRGDKEFLLLTLPLLCHNTQGINGRDLKQFLTEFYKGLDAENHPGLTHMCESIDLLMTYNDDVNIKFQSL